MDGIYGNFCFNHYCSKLLFEKFFALNTDYRDNFQLLQLFNANGFVYRFIVLL